MYKTIAFVMDNQESFNKFNAEWKKLGIDSGFVTYSIYPTKQEVLDALLTSDCDRHSDEIIFVCVNENASLKLRDVMTENKYQEKVLYHNISDERPFRGPSMTWYNIDDLPYMLDDIGRIFAFNENY